MQDNSQEPEFVKVAMNAANNGGNAELYVKTLTGKTITIGGLNLATTTIHDLKEKV